jgi:hypothetical protein
MKYLWRMSLVLLVLTGCILIASCKQASPGMGLLQGAVTIGPIFPVEIPGDTRPVPPETFSSRKIMIYDGSGKKLVREVSITQIGQTANGYYTAQLAPGTYTIDTNHLGIDRSGNLPQKVTLSSSQTVSIDINIDTGIR